METSLHSKPTPSSARWLSALALPLLALAACGDKIDPVQIGDGTCSLVDPVVYTGGIDGVLETHCTSCHASSLVGLDRLGAPADVDLDRFADAERWADRVLARVSDGSMPPPGPPRVGVCEFDGIARWIELGTPQTEEDL